jgi:hypothetical protein
VGVANKNQRKEKGKIFRNDKGEGKDCVLAYGTYGTWAYEYLFLPLSLFHSTRGRMQRM